MDEIRQLARRYKLPIVEDACQALGARYRGEAAGTMGEFGCISFFPSKNLGGAGDGGMVIARDGELAARVRLLRTHGGERKYYHAVVGFNSRLDELQAAILRVKLKYLGSWNRARRENATAYAAEFQAAGLGAAVSIPETLDGREHIFHQYVIRCQRRDALRACLAGKGIGTEVYYPLSLHEQECFRALGYRVSDFPHAVEASREVLALPVYPELTTGQRAHVVRAIAGFYTGDVCHSS
jgi:dTDP-4-amino-4,6-dideoxygalactose transaminase